MRVGRSHAPLFSYVIALALLVLVGAGCALLPTVESSSTAEGQPQTQPAPAKDARGASSPDAAAKSAQEYADRVSGALAKPAATANMPEGGEVPPVRWLEVNHKSKEEPVAPVPAKVEPPPPPVTTEPALTPAAQRSENYGALLEQLRQELRASSQPVLTKALAAAGLSLADSQGALAPADLVGLDPAKQEVVRRYHRLLVGLAQQIMRGDITTITVATVARLLDSSAAAQPIKIRTAQLCKRVRGYGVYDLFAGNTFVAGRDLRMIVYVELENFRTLRNDAGADAGQYQVKVNQEVMLLNQADGLEVWRQPRVEIVDESRNQRRDFFVVQMIDLPARLGAGQYRLKVRVTDLIGNSVDEASVPIRLVTDVSMPRD